MADEAQQQQELDPDPASTYGATQSYKDRWHEKYGKKDGVESAPSADSTGTASPAPGGAEGNRPNDPLRSVASTPDTP